MLAWDVFVVIVLPDLERVAERSATLAVGARNRLIGESSRGAGLSVHPERPNSACREREAQRAVVVPVQPVETL